MRRQDRRRRGRLGDRLRGDPQQLLPAGDAGADGGVRRDLGVRSRDAPLPRLRLRRARRRRPGGRPGRGLRAPAADRLPVGAAHLARPRWRDHMRGLYPRLARRGAERLPARARAAASPSTASRCSAWRPRPARRARGSPRASRSPASPRRLGRRDARCETTRRARSRSSRSSWPSGRGSPRLWEMLGLPEPDRRSPAGRLGRARACRCGPTGTCRRARSALAPVDARHRRRRRVAGAARRLPSPAARRRRRADHRRAVGHLREAGPRIGPGRRPAAAGGPRASSVDPYPTGTRRARLPRPLVRGALALHGALRGLPRRATARCARAGPGAFTADNFPVFDYMRPERLRRRGLEPRLQDDRGRARDRPGARGEHSSLLHPFRFERFATGDLHPVSHSPYPWS